MRRGLFTLFVVLVVAAAIPAMAAAPDGAALYKSKCTMCHAADGSGNTPAGKSMKVTDLRSPEVQKQTDIKLNDTIAGGKGKMPAFGKKMTTPEIQAVIAFIRTLKK